MNSESQKKKVTMVGMIAPCANSQDKSEVGICLIAPGKGEYTLLLDNRSAQLKNLVYEEVSVRGFLLENDPPNRLQVDHFTVIKANPLKEWDDDYDMSDPDWLP